jgi:putative ABC transport system permease protein
VTKFALRGLLGRKLRALLTGIAIVLGVAMISGTYVLTDTVQRAFNNLLVDAYAGTDAVVTGKGLDISIDGETPPPPPVDESLLEVVRGVEEVELATGSIFDERNAKVLTPEGESVSSEGFPTLAFGIDTSPAMDRFNRLSLFEGRWPAAADEVVVDAETADEQGYALGDTVQISTLQPKQGFELVGVAKYGEGDSSLGAISFVVFTIPAAQALLGREGQYDAIQVAAREGLSQDEVVAAVEPALPADAEVVSAIEEAEEQAAEVSEFTTIFRYFLLAFGAIALFVGGFVIFNTFSITVAQRTREFATLRTLGASRRQVLASVILESLVIGLLASLLGLALGVLLAEGIEALFGALGVDLPSAGRVFATRTVVVALVVGVGITLVAGLFPAIRATRVPPIAAVREGAVLPPGRFHRFTPWIAGLFVAASLLLLARAMFTDELGTSDRLLSIAGGVLLLFLGVGMLSSHLVRPLAVVVGWPARGFGTAGKLASGNAVRNPSRTAATAAALMIGIALVAFIATLTNGMKASNREAIEEQVVADYVVTSLDGYTPFVSAAGDALAESSVPETVTNVRSEGGQVDGGTSSIGGIEPDTISEAYVFDWQDGDDGVLATLGTTNAVVSSNWAEDHDVSVGDTLTIRSTADRTADVTVVGTFEPPPFYPLLESVNVSVELFDSLYDRPRNRWTWANVPGEPTEEGRARMEQALAGFPDTQLETRDEWIQREDQDINEFISFLYVMLTLAVFVSIFGMINTLVLSVYERTREIGMLRAIGMTRRQVRRMVRQESIITALIGAAIGLPLGIFLAALVNRALSEYDVRFAIPWVQLVILTVVAVIIGILAAIMPARRAAKLDPLRAIAYE